MNYHAIQVKVDEPVCYLRLYRPEAGNTINAQLIQECCHALKSYAQLCSIVVLEGLPEVFCYGADFQDIKKNGKEQDPEPLYNLWTELATGDYISVAHVRGKTNAGGVGFVSACDIVLADETASFSLSELLFGLFPACVLPFLIRRIGYNKAHYMTLLNKPISVQQALSWGLVDACESNSVSLLRKHLLRLRRISKTSIAKYKNYMLSLNDSIIQSKHQAIQANSEMFSDIDNREKINRYVQTGKFPWET
ncbi:MAG: enoyl-CoA hydratase/isomerase [Gammaproteobacteria bacterium]|nr:enoyl-CoA hydratase/isomerase [Gammaproteobacteria bacterium]